MMGNELIELEVVPDVAGDKLIDLFELTSTGEIEEYLSTMTEVILTTNNNDQINNI